ncbi:major capsid protein E [Lactiplantibacillus plantarum]|uniref:major capsid protein n=1 Tax=Lactiplantibacillus plantarum TaxID=1590 RepID=UPI000D312A16|nr:major capsid protein [Lactiplantibacillus plantarum]MBO2713212.1 major capsid protein [Lactiplantibacillus plantarum]PTM28938.1 major capsid protein E [Lactiplantibacillus plantarum]
MTTIADLFSQHDLIDYSLNRQYPAMVGDELFPVTKVNSLTIDVLNRQTRVPVIASVSAFDAEAEIGSRSASSKAIELALIKRKMQIKEQDLYALLNPRTPAEATYLKTQVFNDFDVLNQGVLARVEKMAMEVLATGKTTLADENGKLNIDLDYGVPSEHKEALTGTKTWDGTDADILADITRWCDAMDITPTRALTSRKAYRQITTNAKVLQAIFGNSTRALGQADFDAFMQAQGLPVIRTYDQKYKDGTGNSNRYFPENRIVLMNDDPIGNKVFGPTPEELMQFNGAAQINSVGNVYDMIYTESHDPIGTFEKASAVALPAFAAADEVFQAQIFE